MSIFVFSFDNLGFEAIINLTEMDEKYLMAKMADDDLPEAVNTLLHSMKMRATFNQQRHPEIWLLNVSDELTQDSLWDFAKTDPQGLADMVRGKGNCFFGSETEPHVNTVII